MIVRLERIGVAVQDVTRMHVFYADVLGLETSPFHKGDTFFTIRVGSISLGFFQTSSAQGSGRSLANFLANPAGYDHLVYGVDDLEKAVAALREKGVSFMQPLEFPGPNGPLLTYRLSDPEGNLIGIQAT